MEQQRGRYPNCRKVVNDFMEQHGTTLYVTDYMDIVDAENGQNAQSTVQ
jgi:hypothetical protein